MKEIYILQASSKASSKAFVKSIEQNEIENTLVITADPNKAKQYERCGDAMIAAVIVNDIFEKDIFKVVSMSVK